MIPPSPVRLCSLQLGHRLLHAAEQQMAPVNGTRNGRLITRRGRAGLAPVKHLLSSPDLSVKLLQDVHQLVHHLLLDGASVLDALEVGEQLKGAFGAAKLAEAGVNQLTLRLGAEGWVVFAVILLIEEGVPPRAPHAC